MLAAITRNAANQFSEDRCGMMAASLAYYMIFALPPILFLLVMTMTWWLSWSGEVAGAAQSHAAEIVERQAAQLLGNRAAEEQIAEMVASVSLSDMKSFKALIGILGVLLGATGVMSTLQAALNHIWQVQSPQSMRVYLRNYLFKRLISVGMILGLGFTLLVSFLIHSVIEVYVQALGDQLGVGNYIVAVTNQIFSFLVTWLFLSAIFRFMPDVRIDWKDVWLGGLVTALLFFLGRMILQGYLQFAEPAKQLGSAASAIAAILVWIYYSSMILLFGAELTKAWMLSQGKSVRPEPGAAKV